MNVSRRRYMGRGEEPRDYSLEHLTFEALEAGTFKIGVTTEYSLDDGSTWTTLAANTETPTIQVGGKVLWRRNSASAVNSAFVATGNFNVYGNVMSLFYGDDFENKLSLTTLNALQNLFSANTKLISAKNLILQATTLGNSAYGAMFYACRNLTEAPKELPAATFTANGSYSSMFYACTNLVKSPKILSKSLTNYTCRMMFRECTKLKLIQLMAETITSNSLYLWVTDVPSSGGTFIKKRGVEIARGNSGIPANWTVIEED